MVHRLLWIGGLMTGVMAGCRSTQVRDAEYAQLTHAVCQSHHAPDMATAVHPHLPELDGPQPIDALVLFALQQNPEIHAARKKMEAFAHKVPRGGQPSGSVARRDRPTRARSDGGGAAGADRHGQPEGALVRETRHSREHGGIANQCGSSPSWRPSSWGRSRM